MIEIPQIPIGEAIVDIITFLRVNFSTIFDIIRSIISAIVGFFYSTLIFIPPVVLIAIFALISWKTAKIKVAIFAVVSLLLIISMDLWNATIETLSLVLVATIIALFIGFPLGILKARSKAFGAIIEPMLDLMQTLPSLSYLIPAVLFFRIGVVPGVIATVIFSMPPAIRLTSLGLEHVSKEMIEVGKSFGATPRQLLLKIEIPLALPSIMMGVNQTIMLAFSMVVIAGFIGAGGLGEVIISGLQRYNLVDSIEAGLSIVFLAIILDRVTKQLGKIYDVKKN
ncbi:MAG TPA: ABC transporter permease subunit [Methanofastidiosum sp.]|nr:ABC transporter permease subunit [Methanofastidiosum sp.]HNU61721.1 ABC transporter permease subunit [Methanofastidiosum sp.]